MAELFALFGTIGEAAGAEAAIGAGAEAAAGAGEAAAAGSGFSMGTLGTVAGLGGTALTAAGQLQAGAAQKAAMEAQAEEERRKGTEALAIATRKSDDRRREGAILASNIRSGAAASGGGVTNPTILDILGEAENRGSVLADSETFQGLSAANSAQAQAGIDRFKGQSAYDNSLLEAFGTGLKGAYNIGRSRAFG